MLTQQDWTPSFLRWKMSAQFIHSVLDHKQVSLLCSYKKYIKLRQKPNILINPWTKRFLNIFPMHICSPKPCSSGGYRAGHCLIRARANLPLPQDMRTPKCLETSILPASHSPHAWFLHVSKTFLVLQTTWVEVKWFVQNHSETAHC